MPLKFGYHLKRSTIGQQVAAMREKFPQFKYHRGGGYWLGVLQPRLKSPEYHIKVVYHMGWHPRVYVLSPALVPNPPHIYTDDMALCLYYPQDGSWSSEMLIAKTILPWTADWLYYYELWLTTDKWFGEEAPHSGRK